MKRSLLFIPGNRPNMIQNGLVLPADALIFDLEDSVLEEEKDAARTLVASALSSLDFGLKELVVRINEMSSPHALKDIEAVVPAGCESILLPKTEHSDDILKLDGWLDTVEQASGIPPGSTSLILLIETALGVEKAFELARVSKRVKALALGAEDLAADLGCERTGEGTEILYSRTRLVIAARAADVEVFDTPFTDAYDEQGCFLDTVFARNWVLTASSAYRRIIWRRSIRLLHRVKKRWKTHLRCNRPCKKPNEKGEALWRFAAA